MDALPAPGGDARDGDEVHRVIDAIDKQHVYLSAANREELAFWRNGEEAR